MRALRKGQARPWCLQPGIWGEVRLVERAFGIGTSALTEAMGMLNHHFAAAAWSAQSDSLPLTAANLCNRARWVMNNRGTDAAVLDALIAKRNADRAREEEVAASAAEAAAREQDQKRIDARQRDERRHAKARKRTW